MKEYSIEEQARRYRLLMEALEENIPSLLYQECGYDAEDPDADFDGIAEDALCRLYKNLVDAGFSGKEIEKMDGEKALKFWKKYKPILMAICEEK